MENHTAPQATGAANKLLALASRHKVLTFFLVLLAWFLGDQLLTTPWVKSTPDRKIVISGEFPFDKGLGLQLDMGFESSNPSCKRMGRAFFLFPTAEINLRKTVQVPVTRLEGNRYTAEIAIDHYHPGYCKWEYRGIGYNIFGGKQSAKSFEGLGGIPLKIKRENLYCRWSEVAYTSPPRWMILCRDETAAPVDERDYSKPAELNFIWVEE